MRCGAGQDARLRPAGAVRQAAEEHRDLLLLRPAAPARARPPPAMRRTTSRCGGDGGRRRGRVRDAEGGAAARRRRRTRSGKAFEGVIPNLRRRYEEGSWAVQEDLEPFRRLRECPACHGHRLQAAEPRGAGQGPRHRRLRQPADQRGARRCSTRFELTEREALIASRVLREIRERAAVPARCRRRLSDAEPQRGDALGRRGAAHPAGHADRRAI